MTKKTFTFNSSSVSYYFESGMPLLKELTAIDNTILLTDENVFHAHVKKFKHYNCIVLKPGEPYKVQQTVDAIIDQLIEMGADRKTTLVGIGGGVITDITGYIAAVFMRGISFGFIPTSLLAMVDASIGGKNGIDVGVYKNMVGVIRQPAFIIYDMAFLQSLPQHEWESGFAEVIKHACIKDAAMFRDLEKHSLAYFQKNKKAVGALVHRNALLKTKVVLKDELETGERKLLNFGHTLGHAIENIYELSHGQAVSIGITYACTLSNLLLGFKDTERVTALLEKYQLPTYADFDKQNAFEVMLKDKKKNANAINYILLQKIGKAVISNTELATLHKWILSV